MPSTSRSGEPTGSSGATSDDWVEVGRVLRPHGVRGEVRVGVDSDVESRFVPGAEVWARSPAATPRRRDDARPRGRPLRPRRLEIATARPHKDGLLVQFAGVADRDAAETLRDALLLVPRTAVPPAPPDRWYAFDLVGRFGVINSMTWARCVRIVAA